MTDLELIKALDRAEQSGFELGVQHMQQRILIACENGTPVELNGKAYFVQDAVANLRYIVESLGEDKRIWQ